MLRRRPGLVSRGELALLFALTAHLDQSLAGVSTQDSLTNKFVFEQEGRVGLVTDLELFPGDLAILFPN
jgi:hypothetical protein